MNRVPFQRSKHLLSVLFLVLSVTGASRADVPGQVEEPENLEFDAISPVRGGFFPFHDYQSDKVARKAAVESHERACETWKKTLDLEVSGKVSKLSLDCGTSAVKVFSSPQGYQVTSEARVSARSKPDSVFVFIQERIKGSGDYYDKCFAWQRKLKQKLGDYFLFSTCGTPKKFQSIYNTNNIKTITNEGLISTGVVVLVARRGELGSATRSLSSNNRWNSHGVTNTPSYHYETSYEQQCQTWLDQTGKYFNKDLVYTTCLSDGDAEYYSGRYSKKGTWYHYSQISSVARVWYLK